MESGGMKMEQRKWMEARHAVRQYTDQPLPAALVEALQSAVNQANAESGLSLQLVTDDPAAFSGGMAHYGHFEGVRNYLALVGPKGPDLDVQCGWYGEKIVLLAQSLGLNSCWVAMTFSKGAVKKRLRIAGDEKLALVVALGYGRTAGTPHTSKTVDQVTQIEGEVPDWFRAGVLAALLAPTAVNQQKFRFRWDGRQASVEATGGFYSRVDLGIAAYHFAAVSQVIPQIIGSQWQPAAAE
jgi:hypothetical protein